MAVLADETYFVPVVRDGVAYDPANPGDPLPLLDREDTAL